MTTYRLSSFATLIESHLFSAAAQHAVFHRLTGQLLELEPSGLVFLQALAEGKGFSVDPEDLSQLGESGDQIRKLINLDLVISTESDPLAPFIDFYLGRPMQNPALTYQNESGQVSVVSISMAEKVYSPEPGQLPRILEETFSELATRILLSADGTKTMRQIYAALQLDREPHLYDREFRDAIKFLTEMERQLIKVAPGVEGFANAYYPANLVPRNLYHASRWSQQQPQKSIGDFHLEGIDNAAWEFDIIEPTVNHGLRFPSQLLAGLDYGTRFYDALFSNGFSGKTQLEVLEIGGGTGSFAHSFIKRAQQNGKSFAYQIMDLSPTLSDHQRRLLSDIEPAVGQINHDAVQFDLPGCQFDLIISNEVIADFPVAAVERQDGNFSGEGAAFIETYALTVDEAPERFYVNSGVFQFLERAWTHLKPGGLLVLSEYGSKMRYPAESFHLNHSEFTIHFGHLIECARKIGFDCRLEMLIEYLGIDDRTPVLCGREEHILCLNYVFGKHGVTMPFALFSEADFSARFDEVTDRLKPDPIRFLPLRHKFYYGPNLDDFFVAVLQKPAS